MKRIIITTIAFITVTQFAAAQEKLSRDEALHYAGLVSAEAKRLNASPIKTDVDLQQPVAMREEEFGAMVLPQRNLSPESLAKDSGTGVAPIGQLWLHKLTPMRAGEAVSSDKLRMATVQADGDDVTVPMCALGLRRQAGGTLELVVFGKDKEPLLAVPVKAIDTKQQLPVDLKAERESESGRLTLNILGKYQASFDVTQLD